MLSVYEELPVADLRRLNKRTINVGRKDRARARKEYTRRTGKPYVESFEERTLGIAYWSLRTRQSARYVALLSETVVDAFNTGAITINVKIKQ